MIKDNNNNHYHNKQQDNIIEVDDEIQSVSLEQIVYELKTRGDFMFESKVDYFPMGTLDNNISYAFYHNTYNRLSNIKIKDMVSADGHEHLHLLLKERIVDFNDIILESLNNNKLLRNVDSIYLGRSKQSCLMISVSNVHHISKKSLIKIHGYKNRENYIDLSLGKEQWINQGKLHMGSYTYQHYTCEGASILAEKGLSVII